MRWYAFLLLSACSFRAYADINECLDSAIVRFDEREVELRGLHPVDYESEVVFWSCVLRMEELQCYERFAPNRIESAGCYFRASLDLGHETRLSYGLVILTAFCGLSENPTLCIDNIWQEIRFRVFRAHEAFERDIDICQ